MLYDWSCSLVEGLSIILIEHKDSLKNFMTKKLDYKNNNLDKAIYGFEKSFPQYSVRLWLTGRNRIYLFLLPLLLMIAIILAPSIVFLTLFFLLNLFYIIAQSFKLILIIIGSCSQKKEELIVPDSLPVYTILLPVYKEDKVIASLVKSIEAIDYPAHLLDVKLLIEQDDKKTLNTLKNIKLPEFFEVIEIPLSYPRTKPKACNYGLQFAKGKYITIYDGEDKPSIDQLKKIVAKFAIADDKVICIQARLNYYNRLENNLTKLFAIEYSLLFDYMLLGLKKLSMPIPLGGTSNHFIRDKLEELGGWDAFNVTEDADLGMRLHYQGYRTDLIDSLTLEEAPISLKAWLVQRSRWIKGHVLTSLLHLTQIYKLNFREVLGILLCLYLPNIIYLLLPIYLVLSLFIVEDNGVKLFWEINLLLGVVLPVFYSIFIIWAKKWNEMKLSITLSILYYWLLPIAGIRALLQIFISPFKWDKTEHGLSKIGK